MNTLEIRSVNSMFLLRFFKRLLIGLVTTGFKYKMKLTTNLLKILIWIFVIGHLQTFAQIKSKVLHFGKAELIEFCGESEMKTDQKQNTNLDNIVRQYFVLGITRPIEFHLSPVRVRILNSLFYPSLNTPPPPNLKL